MVKSKKRRPAALSPAAAQKRFNKLVVKLARTTDGEQQTIIRKELARVVQVLNTFSREAKRERGSTGMPKSYLEERKAKVEIAARISGRRTIRAHMVQGGAPGSGRGR